MVERIEDLAGLSRTHPMLALAMAIFMFSTPTDIQEMNPAQCCAVDPAEPVHMVYNPREFNQRAVSLHVYSKPFDSCVVYSEERGTCGEIKLSYTTEYGKKN